MPIVPEKRELEDHVHGAVGAQFWGQGIENARCLSGSTCTAPCEPQPLRLTAPSGLSRAQLLVAAHAVRLPLFPAFCAEHGGTVLDRVLLQAGSQTWWGALIGRAKVQRGIAQHGALPLRANLSDPDNYALAATGRLQLSNTAQLRATLQADSLQALQPLLPQQRLWQVPPPPPQQQQQAADGGRGGRSSRRAGRRAAAAAADGGGRAGSRLAKLVQGNSLALQLKQQLEGLDLTASLAVNEATVEGVTRYATTPLRLALDLAPSTSSGGARKAGSAGGGAGSSPGGAAGGGAAAAGSAGANAGAAGSSAVSSARSSRLQGLLFRVGLHGTVAPLDDAAPGTAAREHEQQQHRVCLHAQGALALSGSCTLWEAPQKPWQAAAAAASAAQRRHQKQQQQAQAQAQQQAELRIQPLQLGGSDMAAASGPPSSTGATAGSDAPASGSSSGSSSSGSSGARKHHAHRSRHSSSSAAGKKRSLVLQGQEIPLPLCSPPAVQEALQEASSRLERLRTDLRLWQGKVEAGELQRIGHKRKPAGLLSYDPASCWSSFLPAPHFKVSGLLGVLGRVPLHQHTLLLPPSFCAGSCSSSSANGDWQQLQRPRGAQLPPRPPGGGSGSSSSASLASGSAAGAAAREGPSGEAGSSGAGAAGSGQDAGAQQLAPESGRPLGSRAKTLLAASATQLDRLVVGSARRLGSSLAHDSTLRLFGSGGASLQLGEMRGNFCDFTRLEAALDLGLNAPATAAPCSGGAAGAPGSGGVSGGGGAHHGRRRRGAAAAGGGMVRVASPARGLASILGPAAVAQGSAAGAAAAAGAAQPSPLAAPAAAAPEPSGLPPAPPAPVAAASRAHKHPAFALDDRACWHALTVSATQQLVGPVRLRADWRLALDSAAPCPRGTGLLQPSAPLQLLRHVAGVRPALVDSAYGLDCMLPGAGGLLRLAGWWAPGRGEAGVGLRLM